VVYVPVIDNRQKKVDTAASRLKCTSITLIVFGALGVVSSVIVSLFARPLAEVVDQLFRGSEHEEDTLSRNEFNLYDSIKGVCMASIIISACLLALGFAGKRASNEKKAMTTKGAMAKSYGILALMLIAMIGQSSLEFEMIQDFLNIAKSTDSNLALNGNQPTSNSQYAESSEALSLNDEFSFFGGNNPLSINMTCEELVWLQCLDHEDECKWCIDKTRKEVPYCTTIASADKLPSQWMCDLEEEDTFGAFDHHEYTPMKNDGQFSIAEEYPEFATPEEDPLASLNAEDFKGMNGIGNYFFNFVFLAVHFYFIHQLAKAHEEKPQVVNPVNTMSAPLNYSMASEHAPLASAGAHSMA